MSLVPETNPASAPVGVAQVPTSAPPGRSLVGWRPTGFVMAVTFALLQLMNEVGSLMVVPLYGGMMHDLGLTPATVSWSLLATTIASAATLGAIVRLADNFGHKRLLVITLTLVGLGFALSALAPNLIVLVIGRVLVGVTAAPALCLAILTNRLNLTDQRRAIGIITGGLAIAVFVGFVIGGLLLQFGASWRAALWAATALTAISMIGLIWVPETDVSERKKSSLDIGGLVLLAVALTALCVGLSQAGTFGWTSAVTLVLVIGGVVVGAGWLFWESRHPDPVVDPRLIVSRRLLPAFGTWAVIGFVAFFLYQLVVTYASTSPATAGYGFGLTALFSGFVLLPVTVGGLITSRTTPIWLAKAGPRPPLIVGAIVFSLAFLWLFFFHSEIWQYEVGIMLFGLSVTTTITTIMAVQAAEAPPERAAGVNGIYMVLSTVAVSIGTAVYAAIMDAGTVEGQAFVTEGTYSVAYFVMFLVSLLGIVFALVLPRNSAANPHAHH